MQASYVAILGAGIVGPLDSPYEGYSLPAGSKKQAHLALGAG